MKSVKEEFKIGILPIIGFSTIILFGVLWVIMVTKFVAKVGSLGPMGVFFPFIGLFFIGAGTIELIAYIKRRAHDDER